MEYQKFRKWIEFFLYFKRIFLEEEEEEEKLDAYLRIPVLQDFNYQERRMRRKKEKRNI